MVRVYCKEDIETLIKLFKLHHELSDLKEEKKRQKLEDGMKVLVFEKDDEVTGMCSYDIFENAELGTGVEMIISVEQDTEIHKTANALWEGLQGQLQGKKVSYRITYFDGKQPLWRDFYLDKGFTPWFESYTMIYKGGSSTEAELTFRNYHEGDFDTYFYCLAECFTPLRRANDIRPFNIYNSYSAEKVEEVKKETLKAKDCIFLFYDGDTFVGSSRINHEEIDDLFVVPAYQGQGYGRKIMQMTLKMALEMNFDKITLGVVAWNKAAINLYESLGFEICQTIEHKRLIL